MYTVSLPLQGTFNAYFYKWNIDCSSSHPYLLPEQHDFVTKFQFANRYEPFKTRTEQFWNSCIPFVYLVSIAIVNLGLLVYL